eukprot:CAMPEP_0202448528 /NCGR_PEP_ID=MMETSP1360-20130828/7347_1 /ASSEMBLY_ACC=CAM_ASM_000848 /TAXON_ID=515479 /ORGANISM="Licmophora paradoxa, Strain CCMP2313" /LENGTH=338 /DNA_ID=CAMNT_0049066155 /DNA_START=576 /DNA_END=1592 /DNA_ORIENTATION=+
MVGIHPSVDDVQLSGVVSETDDPKDVLFDASLPPKKRKKRDAASMRKAPQAPKRFKSSYICFFMAKQPLIKEELGDKANVTEVSKRSAEMWRNLSTEDRAYWDDVAEKDKQRYMAEKATYAGPWQVPWKRARKDPSAPKRPMSAFLYFSQERRKQIKNENPSMKNTEISRILGDIWRNASEEEKRPHVEREKSEREKYKIEIAKWREDQEKKIEDQRKQQQVEQANYANMYGAIDPSQPGHVPPYPPPHYGHEMGYPPPSYAYGYPMYSYPPPQAQYGFANGKHVQLLAPNGMPQYVPPPAYGPPSSDMEAPPPDDGPQNSYEEGSYEHQTEDIAKEE